MKKNSYEKKNWMEKGYDHDPMIWFWLFVFLIFTYGIVSIFLDFRGWIL